MILTRCSTELDSLFFFIQYRYVYAVRIEAILSETELSVNNSHGDQIVRIKRFFFMKINEL